MSETKLAYPELRVNLYDIRTENLESPKELWYTAYSTNIPLRFTDEERVVIIIKRLLMEWGLIEYDEISGSEKKKYSRLELTGSGYELTWGFVVVTSRQLRPKYGEYALS